MELKITFLVLVLCTATSNATSPLHLRISTLDCIHTFTWDVQDKSSAEVNSTVYKLYEKFDDDFNTIEEWLPVPGCINITDHYCVMKEPLDEFTLTHVYRIGDSPTTKLLSQIPEDELLYYTPFRDETLRFSAPEFQVNRSYSRFHIEFQQERVSWWGNITVAQYLREMGFFLTYYIQYYGFNVTDDGIQDSRTKLHSKILVATESELSVTTSVPDEWFLCVNIRIIYEEKADNISSPNSKKCLEPLSDQLHAAESFIFRWLLPIILMSTIAVVIATVCIYRQNWKKIYTRVFSIQEIKIPDFKIETWMLDSHSPRIFADEDIKEVADSIYCMSEQRTESGHVYANLPKSRAWMPSVTSHDLVFSESLNNSSFSLSDASFPESDDTSSNGSYQIPDVIFYENKPGPYVPSACSYVTIEQAFSLQERYSEGKDEEQVKLTSKEGRLQSSDSAFYEESCGPNVREYYDKLRT